MIGSQFSMPMLGLVGYLMSNEVSVRAALKTLVLSLRLQDRSAVVGLVQPTERLRGADLRGVHAGHTGHGPDR